MLVTLEVSKVSGWLNAFASFRVKGGGGDTMYGFRVRCGSGGREVIACSRRN